MDGSPAAASPTRRGVAAGPSINPQHSTLNPRGPEPALEGGAVGRRAADGQPRAPEVVVLAALAAALEPDAARTDRLRPGAQLLLGRGHVQQVGEDVAKPVARADA